MADSRSGASVFTAVDVTNKYLPGLIPNSPMFNPLVSAVPPQFRNIQHHVAHHVHSLGNTFASKILTATSLAKHRIRNVVRHTG